ncbi:TerB family tellurite resistance protein [Cupriavidus sp. amp6]|uniref:TerB family tellurite resistance protein n=1 Tax=Cupriavidus sp. amp6 TaxID=388051 RepID=UPI000686D317|nr:TerB family tellurite resistance protein [Cupriavidus sp. amp6]
MSSAFALWGSSCHIDEDLLRALLTDVDDPALRAGTLALCWDVARADEHLSSAEESLLAQTARHWGLAPRTMAQPQ